MPDIQIVPEVDDSIVHTYIPGFAEPIENNRIVAKSLANRLGNPVVTYAISLGDHIENPITDVPHIYRESLNRVNDLVDAVSGNVRQYEATIHSIGGIAIGFVLEEEPDRYSVLHFHKSVGLAGGSSAPEETPPDRLQDQLNSLTEDEQKSLGAKLLLGYLGPKQFITSMQYLFTDHKVASNVGKEASKELFKVFRNHGRAGVLGCFGVAQSIDLRPTIRSLDGNVQVAASFGRQDQVVDAMASISALSEGSVPVDTYLVDTGHIPLASKRGLGEVEQIADWVTGRRSEAKE